MQNLTLAPLAPLDPCKRKERGQTPRGAHPSPHHAATPMLAQPQVWVFLHPRTPLCPTGKVLAGSPWSHQPQTGCLRWMLVLPGGMDGWMHRHGCTPSPNARQPQCTARQGGGHRAPPCPCCTHLFSSTSFVTLAMKEERKKQRMKMLAVCGPSRSHAHHPAAPHTFIPW